MSLPNCKPSEYLGCLSGDCPHDKVEDCLESVASEADAIYADAKEEIEELREELGCRNRLKDMVNPPNTGHPAHGDFIVYASDELFRHTHNLCDALLYADEIGGKVYERLASDAARQVCKIEELQAAVDELVKVLEETRNLCHEDGCIEPVVTSEYGSLDWCRRHAVERGYRHLKCPECGFDAWADNPGVAKYCGLCAGDCGRDVLMVDD